MKVYFTPDAVERIVKATAQVCQIGVRDIKSRDNSRRAARPRQVAMALSHELRGASASAVGRAFDRDHSTVLHALKAVKARTKDRPELRQLLARVRELAWAEEKT